MPINLEQLENIYNKDPRWIAIPDSKTGDIVKNAMGGSGGDVRNGWKIHISIDPTKISQAANLIAQALNNKDAPRVSIKFAGKEVAQTGQPSKQVAFNFYQEELRNREKIAAFLSYVEFLLASNDIGIDPRQINSDIETAKTKYDAPIFNDQDQTTRFNYRNENCTVLADDKYTGFNITEHEQIFIQQSLFNALPDSQKNNPYNIIIDPLEGIQIKSANFNAKPSSARFFKEKTEPTPSDKDILHKASNFTDAHVAEINGLINTLNKEIQSWWPYPNKDRKATKVQGLRALLIKAQTLDAATAVAQVEQEFPEIRAGNISTRTATLKMTKIT